MPPTTWNPQNRNYYDGDKLIPRSQVRQWVSDANDSLRSKLAEIGKQYVDGSINSAQAELDATDLITNHHSALAVIANGGRDQMDVRSWGRLGPVVKDERAYLADLFRDNENGDVTDERLAARLENYGDAGWDTYNNLFMAYARDAGFDQAINVSGDTAQPCEECDALSAAGPMPIDEIPEIGDRICGPGCGCEIQIVGIDDAE